MPKFDETIARRNSLKARNKLWIRYSDEWYTPDKIVSALGPFNLDPCAGPKRHARINFRLPHRDGLRRAWRGRVWMNPPYREIHGWLQRFQDHGDGIAMVNARPDTRWFQRLAAGASALLWLSGRVQFERPGLPDNNPPVGSVLVAYGRDNAAALKRSGLPGIFTSNIRVNATKPLAP
jgi:hypothetical protein